MKFEVKIAAQAEELARLRKAAQPFLRFSQRTGPMPIWDRIIDWFSESEFVALASALTGKQSEPVVAATEDHPAIYRTADGKLVAVKRCLKCGHPEHKSKMHQNICTFYVKEHGAECGCNGSEESAGKQTEPK